MTYTRSLNFVHTALLDQPMRRSISILAHHPTVRSAKRARSTNLQPVRRALPEVELIQVMVRSRPQRAARRAPFVRDLQRDYGAGKGCGEGVRCCMCTGAGGGQGARGTQGPAADAVVLAGGEEEVVGGVGGYAL